MFAAFGAAAFFGTAAHAADLGPQPLPIVESWTGFSFGVGGGVGFLDADVSAKGSRTDTFGSCGAVIVPSPLSTPPCPDKTPFFDLNQSVTSNLDDLGDTGGFFTVQAAYDYQFAQRWVAGVFVDADWSDISAQAKQTFTSSVTGLEEGTSPISKATVDTEVSTDWNISVGGRLGYLATPGTLLYILGAYTHADLEDARVKIRFDDPQAIFSEPGFISDSPTSLLVKNLPDSLDGFSLGGGGEVKLGGPWALKGEYRWTHLEGGSGKASSQRSQAAIDVESCLPNDGSFTCDAFFRDIDSTASADLDLDIHTVRAVLTYHFWSGGSYGG
jgi:outer membrane immunogenic protein